MPYLGNVPAEAYTNTVKDSFNGDASTTAFTLSQPSTTNNLRVVVENVIQDPTVAYTVSGTTLTFTSAPPVGTANIYAVHLGPATQTAVPPSEITNATTYTSDLTVQGDLTASANVAVTGDLTVDTSTLHVDATNNRVGIGTASPAAASLQIKKDTASTTNELLRLSNSAGSTTDGVKLVMEVANTSGNGGEIGAVRDGGSFNPYMYFSTSAGVGSSPVERMRIASDGSVGIGTSSPSNYYANHLVVDTGSSLQSGITIVSDTTSQGMFAFADGTTGDQRYRGAIDYNHSNDSMAFLTAGAERMSIDQNSVLTRTFSVTSETATEIFNNNNTSGAKFKLSFRQNGTQVGVIEVGTSGTAYITSSDHRLKENVTDLTGASDRVNQIPVHRFNFIAEPDKTVDGFLAHEVQAVVPEAISGTQDEVDADGNPVYQGIDQSKLVPLLTAALQEALAKIETLETEMTSVKARLAALETA